jgi:hypothetical protein
MSEVPGLKCPCCGESLADDSMRCSQCGVRSEVSEGGTTVVAAALPCPTCASENAPTRDECVVCGCMLRRECPKCEEPNAFFAKYCRGCGLDLDEALRQATKDTFGYLTLEEAVRHPDGKQTLAEYLMDEAVRCGFSHAESHFEQYYRLFEEVASPDEQVIVSHVGRRDDYVDLIHNDHDAMLRTSFVATTDSFIFLKRPGFLFGRREAITITISYTDVESLELDAAKGDLVVRFDRGEARVHLMKVANRSSVTNPIHAATAMYDFLKIFVPEDLRRQLLESIRGAARDKVARDQSAPLAGRNSHTSR